MKKNKQKTINNVYQDHKWTWSKVIALIILVLYYLVIFYSCVLMWYTKTTEGLTVLIPSVSTSVGIVIACYMNKASKENNLKLRQAYGLPLEEAMKDEEGV